MPSQRAFLSLPGLSLFAATFVVAACHGTDPKPEASPVAAAEAASPESHAAADAAAPAEKPGPSFHDMDHDARAQFMKDAVMPKMRAAFTGWEPDEFRDMKCAACHGAGAKDKTFKMPNPKLPKLPSDPAGWAALAAEEPEAMKFMKEVVVPEMAKLLGEEPYDPATQKGFGCFECHTAK